LEIRPALRAQLRAKYSRQPDTVITEELGLCRGRVRVDLAVVNGLLHGYEIKSDRDSLRRLDMQVDFYGRVLDRATVVVGERHLAQVLEQVPPWWGVMRLVAGRRHVGFKTVRSGQRNPGGDPRALVELLWLSDGLALLEEREAARGVRGRPRRFVWDRVCEHFTFEEIAAAVRTQLKARAANQARP
jgi:hypothetical protein